jgi:hypothetical protein
MNSEIKILSVNTENLFGATKEVGLEINAKKNKFI